MPTERARCGAESWRGQAGWRLALPSGDSLLVAEQGAHVLSWVAGGRERLYLSPASAADGQTAIRGGVPVCWPQFNQRGPLPKHGFVRNLPWRLLQARDEGDGARLTLGLQASERTRALWPAEFAAELALDLQPAALRLTLTVHNTGRRAWDFSGALHSYLAVGDIGVTTLAGLGGQAEWDAVRDAHGQAADTLAFAGEFDRVYAASAGPLSLRGAALGLEIRQSPSWGHTVVWNPGAERAATLADLPPGGWRDYLCVEAAQVLAPVEVPAGGQWSGWQSLQVLQAG